MMSSMKQIEDPSAVDGPVGSESPVNNAAGCGMPRLSAICEYPRLQGSLPQRARTLQNRAPVDAIRAA